MRLLDYLDKGASLGAAARCLTMRGNTLDYGAVQRLSYRIGRALARSGVRPGDKVAILSGNDPVAFACVFGISRAGAVWCPVNPRNEAAENRDLLDLFGCRCLIFQAAFAPLVGKIVPQLPQLTTLVCLDGESAAAFPVAVPFPLAVPFPPAVAPVLPFGQWLDGLSDEPWQAEPADNVVMLAGTGGTTGRPKGVLLTGHSIETMTAITLMSYPFEGRPRYLALAPLTHAAGVLCFPVMTLGGEIVIMPAPDLAEFIALAAERKITHTFLPPTLIYMLLGHPDLPAADLSALQCLWYGAAPMSATRLVEAITTLGPVLGQLFGQTEAPMMISTLAPKDHLRTDGSIATERLLVGRAARAARAGRHHGRRRPPARPRPARRDRGPRFPGHGRLLQGSGGHCGGLPVRLAPHRRPRLPGRAELPVHRDRAKDMIITGGFNVYSAEVEQALLAHPAIQDCAVVGLPDGKWGERVTAVVQPHPGRTVTAAEVRAFVKDRLGSVKAPKQVEVWPDLPRSKVGKVLKADIKAILRSEPDGRGG